MPTLDGLISAYRYYFYKSEAAMALQMAIVVCNRVQAAKNSYRIGLASNLFCQSS
ncbi:MAG: hypothetical protein AAF609_26165 [Cyanobacteria bacterium P01_C01_bin.120]